MSDPRLFFRIWQGECPLCDRLVSVPATRTPAEAEAAGSAPPRVTCVCGATLTSAVETQDRPIRLGVYRVNWIEPCEVTA